MKKNYLYYCTDCNIKLNKKNRDLNMRMVFENKEYWVYCKKCADIIRHKFFIHE